MNNFSKSELLAFRQCPKRLWLQMKQPELLQEAPKERARLQAREKLKEVARKLYDPSHEGEVITIGEDGIKPAMARSKELLDSAAPIFDGVFAGEGVEDSADVLLPTIKVGNRAWRLVHVRTSTIVREHHYVDMAVQAYVVRHAGVSIVGVSLAHVDSNWVYPGHNNYKGLLVESDLTAKAYSMDEEIKGWVQEAQKILNVKTPPPRNTGRHCSEPHVCGFLKHCQSQEQQSEFPVAWLPRPQPGPQGNAFMAHINTPGNTDMRQVPNAVLNDRQRRVKDHTLSGAVYFDSKNAAADLAPYSLPAGFLAFESIQFAIPTWPNTRPFQPIPFQFSLHWVGRGAEPEHTSFIDLSGNDPSLAFAEALIEACGTTGTLFAYNAGSEKSRIRELADRFPRLRNALLGISERIVDLLKVAEMRYYHPGQEGSWSLKKILPTIAPEMIYDRLKGIKDGASAMRAYFDATNPSVPLKRQKEIEEELVNYVRLDTLAMIKLWEFFSGKQA